MRFNEVFSGASNLGVSEWGSMISSVITVPTTSPFRSRVVTTLLEYVTEVQPAKNIEQTARMMILYRLFFMIGS